jgi:hypothetical protein
MTKTRAALIILTAPKEADMSSFWDYFFSRSIKDFKEDTDLEVRAAALSYLESKIEGY